jgi:hypothetical protein
LSLTDRVVDLRQSFGTLLIIIATPQKTRKSENLRSKIKRKKNSGLSLSLSLPRARARASVRFSLAHIEYRGFSFTFTLRHVDTSFFSQSSPAFRMQKRTRAAPRNETREREREKRDTKKNYEREREQHAHGLFHHLRDWIRASDVARAGSAATPDFCNHRVSQSFKELFFYASSPARVSFRIGTFSLSEYTIWFRVTVEDDF